MPHQITQEGSLWLWSSAMIRFEPHWRNCKITWANIVNALLDVCSIKANSYFKHAVIVSALAGVNETNLIQAEIHIKNFVLIVERAAL